MIMSEAESVMNRIGTFAVLVVALLAMAASVPALAKGGSPGSSQGGSRGSSQGGSHGSYYGGSHGGSYGGYYGGSKGRYYGGSHGGYYGYPRVSLGFAFVGPGYWGYPGWGYPGWGYPGWDYAGYYYPPPYYYYPQAAAVPAEPTAYIERSDAYSPPPQSQGYWYYCAEAKAYYPYVKQCAGGWQRVSPTPPDANK